MTNLIPHHHEPSFHSEKVRICVAINSVVWADIDHPVTMPKPALTPLTGGCRHTSVLAIGAGLVCDGNPIPAEPKRRFPAETIRPDSAPRRSDAIRSRREPYRSQLF